MTNSRMRSRLFVLGSLIVTHVALAGSYDYFQPMTPKNQCQFQFPYAGIRLNDIYNGPITCRNVTTDILKANGDTQLINSQVNTSLFVRGNVSLYHSTVGFVDVFGSIEGRDCTFSDDVNLFGNSIQLENCTAKNINIYYGGISAFPPHLELYHSKVLGTVHFYHRRGYITLDGNSSVNQVINRLPRNAYYSP